MTSIIKVDTIQNKAGSTSLAANKLPDMLSGSAKAFATFNQVTPVVTNSLNISSVTDVSTGRGTYNLTNSMSTQEMTVPSNSGMSGAGFGGRIAEANTVSASSYEIYTFTTSVTYADYTAGASAVFGDLA